MDEKIQDYSHETVSALESFAVELTTECLKEAARELSLVDEALCCLLNLFVEPITTWKTKGIEVVWSEMKTVRSSPTLIFGNLLTNITDSVLATKRLALLGLDRQARTVFRELTETGDLLIAFLGDSDFPKRYYESPEDFGDARRYWSEQLKPSGIRKTVESVVKTITTHNGIRDAKGALSERWKLYAWLSKSAHVDYGALMLGGISPNMNGVYNLNIGGVIGPQVISTLVHLCSDLDFLLTIVSRLLLEKHGWDSGHPELFALLSPIEAFKDKCLLWKPTVMLAEATT